MTSEPEASERQHADGVYLQPAAAQESARNVLERDEASAAERSEALATLGRSAYYDNRLADAIAYLERALSLATTPSTTADISLTLAPALSKAGRPADALDLLELDVGELSAEQRAKLHNQRGIISVETGQLPRALDEFVRARDLHRAAGDSAGEGRSLVNMAAAASELGRLTDAEAWYAEAWQLSTATGQDFSSAIIEGNLGYVASRRGDFGAALDWYQRGRASFAELGDVDLLVAVLETDYATTLLALGLDAAALEAAEYACASSVAGSNRLLEVQALLLVGEAQLRLRQLDRADRSLAAARAASEDLDLTPLRLRSEYLLQRRRSVEGHYDSDVPATLELAAGLRESGWHRESLRTLVIAAQAAFDADDRSAVAQLLDARDVQPPEGADALDRAHADALEAMIAGDAERLTAAVVTGQRQLERERQLVNSAELETRLGHRLRDLRELLLRPAVIEGDARAAAVALDRVGRTTAGLSPASAEVRALRSQLRDVRVGLQEAQLAGAPEDGLRTRSSELEREILAAAEARSQPVRDALEELLVDDSVDCVSYFRLRNRLHAVVTGAEPRLVDLGPVETVHRVMRAHRTGLRRTTSGQDSAVELTNAASAQLSAMLIDPLALPGDGPIAIVADSALAGVSWAGLDALRDREFVIARSLRSALAEPEPWRISSVGLLEAGDLEFADEEIAAVAETWRTLPCSINRNAGLADVHRVLDGVDLAHVVAHGTFRADNPFASAIHVDDGDLRFFELERHDRLPHVMVLASCDSGASADVGSELFGAADTLLSLGVAAVVASTLIVDDGAAARLTVDLHRGLARGASPAGALLHARRGAVARGTPQDRSAAAAFNLYGDASSLRPVDIQPV